MRTARYFGGFFSIVPVLLFKISEYEWLKWRCKFIRSYFAGIQGSSACTSLPSPLHPAAAFRNGLSEGWPENHVAWAIRRFRVCNVFQVYGRKCNSHFVTIDGVPERILMSRWLDSRFQRQYFGSTLIPLFCLIAISHKIYSQQNLFFWMFYFESILFKFT